uniref:Uncharacterized protein n=1 Tax=Opuntia streptacantha TaxID=393608 RepID=A0A7C8ZYK2_OPUST
MLPVNLFRLRSSMARFGRPNRPLGIGPFSRLSSVKISIRDWELTNDSGKFPVRLFLPRFRNCSFPLLPSFWGILPLKLFSPNRSATSSGSSPIKSGIAPCKLLDCRLK